MDEVSKYPKESLEGLKRETELAFANRDGGKKRWALMLFFTEMEMGISNKPNKWVNVRNIFYDSGFQAIEAYSNTKCPASQLVDGETPEELENAMLEMIEHYKDEKWLEENLYPYL